VARVEESVWLFKGYLTRRVTLPIVKGGSIVLRLNTLLNQVEMNIEISSGTSGPTAFLASVDECPL
jgi:hypothetical protein